MKFCLWLHLLKTWNEKQNFIYLFTFTMRLLRPFHQDVKEGKNSNTQKTVLKKLQFGILLNRLPFSGFIVHPFIAQLFVCLHAIPEYFVSLFVNVLVSLNVALCKYLVVSVSVWFHWKAIAVFSGISRASLASHLDTQAQAKKTFAKPLKANLKKSFQLLFRIFRWLVNVI